MVALCKMLALQIAPKELPAILHSALSTHQFKRPVYVKFKVMGFQRFYYLRYYLLLSDYQDSNSLTDQVLFFNPLQVIVSALVQTLVLIVMTRNVHCRPKSDSCVLNQTAGQVLTVCIKIKISCFPYSSVTCILNCIYKLESLPKHVNLIVGIFQPFRTTSFYNFSFEVLDIK